MGITLQFNISKWRKGKHDDPELSLYNIEQGVSADLSGSYIVQGRSSSTRISRVWVLIYLCDNTKALHTEVVEDYSGAGLITALRQTFAVRNMPAQITTDPGRNFVKAESLFSSDCKLYFHKSSGRYCQQDLPRDVEDRSPWSSRSSTPCSVC